MKLKRLSLQGYKTFASKTEFLFDEGITAIVGPNGSGKSNIADALRWVLGEQSYSTLRGKRTEDMIFAGSESRARAGMAQAILMLDNSDKWLPIDFSEVEIGRRAFRSGENEYILNGQKVRLKDVTDLLATSGLAQRTYTIIGQGLVDQALSLRADERRALFEEAAGVNHYKSRRAETLRRLNETQHNLERVHDILAEIKPRLSSLKRQATRARNYEQIRQELRELLRIWYGYRWEQSKVELRIAREGAAAAEKAWQSSRQALLVHQQNADDLQRQINRLQSRLSEAQDQREEARLALEKARRDMAILQERREAIQRRLGDLEQEEPLLEEQRATAEAELGAATAELATAQATLQDSRATLQRFNSSFEVQQAEARRQRAALRATEEERRATQTALAQGEGQLSQLQERLREREAEQNGSSAAEMARLAQEKEQQLKVLATAQQSKDRLSEQREAAQRERQQQIDELKQLRRDAWEQERALGQQRDRVARLEARVDLLDQMRHKEVDLGQDIPVLGRLASLITIPDAHKQALEAAQSARLATLVVENRAALWALVERNAERPLAVAALADVRVPEPQAPPENAGVIGWAAEQINIKKNARPLLDVLLGRVLLVEDRETAYAVAGELPPGAMAVAPDGFVVHAGGVVETVPAAGGDGILAREEAWREAQEALIAAQQELAKAEAATSQQQQIINTRQEAVDAQQNEERRLSRIEAEAAQRVAQAQRRVDRAQQQQDFLQRQQESQAQEISRLKTRSETLQTSLANSREKLQVLDETVVEKQAQLAELPVAEGEQEQQRLQQSVATAQTIVAGRQAVVDSRRTTLNQVEQQLARLAERRSSLLKQQAELENQVETDDAQRLNSRLDQLDATVEPLQRRIRELRQELQTLQGKSGKLQRHAHEMETQYTQSQVRLTQRENQIESLQERIRADLGLVALTYDEDQTGASPLPLQEFVEQLPAVEELPPKIEQSIHEYRGQLQRMGAINPDAPEEFEETQARHDFLTQQIEDLNQAEHHLRGVIAELDELTSRAFADTVHEVDSVFGDTFTQLFGGGSARLVLTEPDDLTVSGVDIIARLPNRREQGLGLLSGGERSLTASALIFSLLKVSPTPFCVLDEVDAALDEANVNRFTDILRELSMTTQFIVITHNRGTVQAAETIYGVSMQPDSASQVISLKPSEYMKVEML